MESMQKGPRYKIAFKKVGAGEPVGGVLVRSTGLALGLKFGRDAFRTTPRFCPSLRAGLNPWPATGSHLENVRV